MSVLYFISFGYYVIMEKMIILIGKIKSKYSVQQVSVITSILFFRENENVEVIKVK